MYSLPDSVPTSIKVSFFEYQRKEWEKVLESSRGSRNEDTPPEFLRHWESVGNYAQAKIQEIDQQLQHLKLNVSAT